MVMKPDILLIADWAVEAEGVDGDAEGVGVVKHKLLTVAAHGGMDHQDTGLEDGVKERHVIGAAARHN